MNVRSIDLRRDLRRFYYEARYVGVRSAVAKGLSRVRSSLRPVPGSAPPSAPQGFELDLPVRSVLKVPLVVIVSDTQIEQCVLYRIEQKRELLRRAGYQCVVLGSSQAGMIRSYLPLARLLIVYRTVVAPSVVAQWQEAGVPVAFEFDDLIVGREQVEASGVLSNLSDQQRASLRREATALWDTATACDYWIVATHGLRERYASVFPPNRIQVLPNFLPAASAVPATKTATFAYTSPSQSVDAELALLDAFCCAYSRIFIEPYDILVIGNARVASRLERAHHPLLTVRAVPFCGYAEYLQLLATAQFVLIPLAATPFNDCKTIVRALDAVRAGVLPLFSPVGEYRQFRSDPLLGVLAFEEEQWVGDVGRLQALSRAYEPLQRAFAAYCETHYGEGAALARYGELLDAIPQH